MITYVVSTEPSFWNAVWPSAVGGILAGLVVAFVLGRVQRIRTPLFELTQVAEEIAILKYNGWIFPVELGKNWELGEGTILSTPNRKGTLEGDRMSPGEEIVVCIDYYRNDGEKFVLKPGGSVGLTYRRRLRAQAKSGVDPRLLPEPFDVPTRRFPRFGAWKLRWIVMKA